MNAEDLLASVFPDQVACAGRICRANSKFRTTHWCVQTIRDCLEDAMDIEGFEAAAAPAGVG